MKFMMVLLSLNLLLVGLSRCKEDLLENPVSLTDSQENELVAAELSQNSGGAMAEVSVLAQVTREDFYSKNAAIDTSIAVRWVQLSLGMSFFRANGNEIPIFVPEFTDSMVVRAHLSGDTSFVGSNTTTTVNLNRRSQSFISDILTAVHVLNGGGSDSSTYTLTGNDDAQKSTGGRAIERVQTGQYL